MSNLPWEAKNLETLVEKFYQGINTVADKVAYVEKGHKVLQAKHITSGIVETTDAKSLSAEDFERYKDKYSPKRDDILLSNIGTIGRTAYVLKDSNYLIAWNIFLISFKKSFYPKFGKYYFEYLELIDHYAKLETGNATKFVNKSELKSLRFPVPGVAEQKKIAEILTSVDKVIELTEIEIENLRNLKKGMMQDLLTKGIGHTSFKKGPMGNVPESWNEFEFGGLVVEKLLGVTVRGEGEKSIPLVKMGNIKEGRFVYDKLEQVDESVIDSSYLLTNGDLLFNTRNTPEMTGKVAVWRGDYPVATFDNNLLRLRFDEKVNPFFMGNLLTSDAIYLKFRGLVTGSNSVAAIYWKDLSKMKLNLPPKVEQDKITEVLLKIENSLEAKILKNGKLKNMKKGLLQDLLTGKVRVKV